MSPQQQKLERSCQQITIFFIKLFNWNSIDVRIRMMHIVCMCVWDESFANSSLYKIAVWWNIKHIGWSYQWLFSVTIAHKHLLFSVIVYTSFWNLLLQYKELKWQALKQVCSHKRLLSAKIIEIIGRSWQHLKQRGKKFDIFRAKCISLLNFWFTNIKYSIKFAVWTLVKVLNEWWII